MKMLLVILVGGSLFGGGYAARDKISPVPSFSAERGFNPEPGATLPASLREEVRKSRLTVVFASSNLGCSAVLGPPIEVLRRFAAAYPEARMLTALPSGLELSGKYRLGDTCLLDSEKVVGFGTQAAGVIAAYDRGGRTLLFKVFTSTSVDSLFSELESAYALTVPNDLQWAALDNR